jgi:hypothetical protein
MSHHDSISTLIPGTLLLGFIAFGGCMVPQGGQGPAYGGGASPASSSSSSLDAPAASSHEQGPTTPAPPQVVSVDLHNDCGHTVKLFLGARPKWGSGTSTSLGSNTTSSYDMKPGDTIWIIDDSENGLDSFSASEKGAFQRVRISSSCTNFAPG